MAEAQNRFDQDVDRAWRQFRARLADHVAAMRDGDGLVLEPVADDASGPAGPCVQFYAWGDDQVRCEVPSNAHLAPDRQLTLVDEATLLDLGLCGPSREPETPEDGGSPAYWIDRPSSWSDQLAQIAVRALRDVWGVPHPLFLRGETFGNDPAITDGVDVTDLFGTRVTTDGQAAPTDTDRPAHHPAVVEPAGEDHVRELIESTLHDRIGDIPAWDEDGDLVLRVAGVPVFVGIGIGGTTVDLFAPIVHSITGRTRAAEVCSDLNRRWPHLKFVLLDDRLAVVDHVRASPFVPAHLLGAFDAVSAFLESVDESFATHVGGLLLNDHVCTDPFAGVTDSPWNEPGHLQEAEDDLPLPLLALRDFHLGGTTEIQSSTVAAIGDWRPEQLRRFLTLSDGLHAWWAGESASRSESPNAESAHVEEAVAKAREWELTSASLSAALDLLESGTLAAPSFDSTDRAPARVEDGAERHRSVAEQPTLFDKPGKAEQPTLFDELFDELGDHN